MGQKLTQLRGLYMEKAVPGLNVDEMFEELKLVFQDHARVERYDVSDKVLQL